MRLGWLRAAAIPIGCALLGASAFSAARARLRPSFAVLGEAEDVTALPSPDQLRLFSLGHEAAVADYLFATTLVRAGRHFTDRKVFEHLDLYLNAIVTLDPYFREVYLFADSLLTFSTVRSPPENYRQARDLLERGLEYFPNDSELWLSAGQFILYLAIPWMSEKEDPQEWRARGASIIQHACQLSLPDLPAGCLSSLRKLKESGESQAAIAAIERMLVLAEDSALRAELEARLAELVSETRARAFSDRAAGLARRHLFDLPLASRTEYQILGPAFDGSHCLAARSTGPECATSFRDLDRDLDAAETPGRL